MRLDTRLHIRRNMFRLTRWRQCVSFYDPTKRGTVSCWSYRGMETMWSGMSIPSRPHWHWNYWYIQKVRLRETINSQPMKIVGVEEDARTKNAWDTTLLNRKKEQKTIHIFPKSSTGKFWMIRATGHISYNFAQAGPAGTWYLQVVHNFAQKKIHQNEPINNNWVLLYTW